MEQKHLRTRLFGNLVFMTGFQLLMALSFFIPDADAHKLSVFAWVEGNSIHTQSKFSGGKPVQNAVVSVFDSEKKLLLEGTTSDSGMFSFRIPRISDLKIEIKASMGHKGEWTIKAEELSPGSLRQEQGASDKSKDRPPEDVTRKDEKAEFSAPVTSSISPKELEKMIEDTLDKKLEPIIRMLTDSRDKGPGITEILGGIGYIIGLAGIVFYMKAGKK